MSENTFEVVFSGEILAGYFFRQRFNTPIDAGRLFFDNKRILGDSKTWRGIVAAVVLTEIAAAMLGYGFETGAEVAIYAMCGDLFASFIKRRLGLASSDMALLLDQVPESLLPAYFLMTKFGLDPWSLLFIVISFIVLELLFSIILYRLGVRKRPY